MRILSALDKDTLYDLLIQFQKNRRPFYFEADAAPGITVVANWEDPEEVDEPTQILQVVVDPTEAEDYIGPEYDRQELDLQNNLLDHLDDELGVLVDSVFRHSINQDPCPHFQFVPEWSRDNHHVYAADVFIRREAVNRV